jgi:hypothetical protein
MKAFLLITLTAAMAVLHQDFWNWRTATPLAFGFMPAGLFYHACYTLGCIVLVAMLVRFAWPAELERDAESHPEIPQ